MVRPRDYDLKRAKDARLPSAPDRIETGPIGPIFQVENRVPRPDDLYWGVTNIHGEKHDCLFEDRKSWCSAG